MIHEAGTLVGMGTHVIAVVGPTATGKSGLAVGLARALGGEIVNADSMQLYQGMDIGTAKEPEAAWQGVPHHLLDVWPVTRTASVADYATLARAAIGDTVARGRVPVLAGGSGLYVRAALGDLEFPGTDHGVRARLEDELARLGPAELHARLARLDPAAAAAILPGNGRRIVRALEVIEISGRPFAATMPVWVTVAGRPARSRQDAAYFAAWIDRTLAQALALPTWNNGSEKDAVRKLYAEARQKMEARRDEDRPETRP